MTNTAIFSYINTYTQETVNIPSLAEVDNLLFKQNAPKKYGIRYIADGTQYKGEPLDGLAVIPQWEQVNGAYQCVGYAIPTKGLGIGKKGINAVNMDKLSTPNIATDDYSVLKALADMGYTVSYNQDINHAYNALTGVDDSIPLITISEQEGAELKPSQFIQIKDNRTALRQAFDQVIKGLAVKTEITAYEYANGSFVIQDTGVYFVEQDKQGNTVKRYLCSPIRITAETRDHRGENWGRLLEWFDRDGRQHKLALPLQMLQSNGEEVRKVLADKGVIISPNSRERTLLNAYLSVFPTDEKVYCTNRVGWHGESYVLPHKTYGKQDIIYQNANVVQIVYNHAGTLEQWKNKVSILCESHNNLVFAICSSFAGELLEPLGLQGQGYHFIGQSSKGKSTALKVACSVWAKPSDYIRSWRTTGNALENTALLHNDGFLALDEMGEISKPSEIGNIAYMLMNGQGKARMTKSLINKPLDKWSVLVLSSGEKGLKLIMQETGQAIKLGQEIRIADIHLDQSQYGIFDSLVFADTGDKQAFTLNQHTSQSYGVAGDLWLEYLTSDKASIIEKARTLYNEYKNLLSKDIKESHILRVAGQFSLLAVAGELATRQNITGWEQGRAIDAVQAVFNQWLANFEYKGKYQQKAMLRQVKAFIELHANSRFEDITHGVENHTLYNRVGFIKQDRTMGDSYIFLDEAFKREVCDGYNYKDVVQALKNVGWLDYKDRDKKQHCINGKNSRYYTLNDRVLTDDLDEMEQIT